MVIKITNRECATILAALRRWHGYPAARDADRVATSGGKYRPLDNVEIEELCQRITPIEKKRDTGLLLRQSDNGAGERKSLKRRNDLRTAQDGSQRAEDRMTAGRMRGT